LGALKTDIWSKELSLEIKNDSQSNSLEGLEDKVVEELTLKTYNQKINKEEK